MQSAQLARLTGRQTKTKAVATTSPQSLAVAGLRGFFGITGKWGLTEKDNLVLLGEPSRATYYNWKKGEAGKLSRDTLERLSYIAGIYKALRILIPDDALAHAWVTRGNDAPIFAGQAPIKLMLTGKMADLYRVRAYLDAHRGGWG
ncbi:MAG: MbcA/ParS/Xre antitoxin family protein [Usitatibacteraceae bacterium]